MRIVLQQRNTGLYLKDVGTWTRDSAEAADFLSSSAAIEFCVANHLNDLHIVLKFDEQKCDIVMPLDTEEPTARTAPPLGRGAGGGIAH